MFDTSFQKKTLYGVILTLLLGVVVLLHPFFVSADTFLLDDFDSYSTGPLNGQGYWICNDSGVVVSTTTYDSAPNSVAVNYGACDANNANLEKIESGTFTIAIKMNTGQSYGHTLTLGLLDRSTGGNSVFNGKVRCEGASADNCIFSYYAGGNWISIKENMARNTWYDLDIWFDHATHTWKARVDDDVWTEEIAFYNEGATGVDDFSFSGVGPLSGWIDSLHTTFECSLGHCSECGIWTTCQTAGCNWSCAPDWSGIGCWCSEPASSPEACGGFFKCQYCETEAACTDVTCEWNTRGGITKCFTKLPVIPEAQEEWQGCEFDDCDPIPPLGTIEKWICVLRNSIQGIYCPTQATMSALQDTVNSFETKFPFNYIEAMKQFFIDIKTSLATAKTVPIKMFGVSMGNLDFSIFDSNITIGGQTETIGEFCTFASTILLYFGLFFWLLAIIRRFF